MTPGSRHPAAKSTRGQRVDGSMCPRVNGSNGSMGQRVTFTILYMIADDATLTPPRCKKHTAYDDTRLTPHRCKNHTASFARSTGKFPSTSKGKNIQIQSSVHLPSVRRQKGLSIYLTLKVLVTTIEAQWEGMGDVGSARYEMGTTSPMPDHNCFKLQ